VAKSVTGNATLVIWAAELAAGIAKEITRNTEAALRVGWRVTGVAV
jgi:hypothetical protein